jgi:endonuclease/exonuclease/phosphatase family metal-dependent hydrolase
MRLVSLNTWKAEGDYVRRIDAMAAGLSALSPDVIALQEDLRTADGLTHTALALARALGLQLSWVPARS